MNTLTNSERSTHKRCIRKWHYCYGLGRIPVLTPEPFFFGSAIGLGLDAIWNDKPFINPFQDYLGKHGYKDIEKLWPLFYKGRAMLTVYKELYANDKDNWELIATEHPISYDMGGVTLRGMLDKVLRNKANGQLYVLDHKTTKDDIDDPSNDYWQIKILDPQLVGYMVALEAEFNEPVTMIYDTIKKHGSKGPKMRKGVRRKKTESDEEWEMRKADETESWDEYASRVMTEYRTDTDKYFKRRVIERTKEEMEEFRTEFLEDAVMIESSKATGVYPMNHGSCGKAQWKCEYFNVCTKMESIESDSFKTKQYRHPELDGDGDMEEVEDVII
tara:strand:- start:967 stop:1956 length:990 start_codon:yes stop_codon:yes gene_type:complete